MFDLLFFMLALLLLTSFLVVITCFLGKTSVKKVDYSDSNSAHETLDQLKKQTALMQCDRIDRLMRRD